MALVAADGGGSPVNMALQVAPEDLLAAAESFDKAADRASTWISLNGHLLVVEAPGADQVSKNMAAWLTANANGAMGAIPAVQKAIDQLRATAVQMRATASSYGITNQAVASDVAAAGQS